MKSEKICSEISGGIQMHQKSCPICTSNNIEPLMTLKDIPVFVNALPASAEEAIHFATGTQALTQCLHCGFVFNADFESEKVAYSQDYHAERSSSAYYNAHIQHVADLIDSVEPIKDKFVLEVACNSGEFLENLVKYAPWAAIGVDPSAPEKDAKLLVLQRAFFDEEYLQKMSRPVDILINRHMIEHIQNPLGMLRLFWHGLSENGILYIETPRLDWILEHKAFFDFSYEHCAYYSDKFFGRLLSAAGFKIAKMSTSYSDQYFSVIAKKAGPFSEPIPVEKSELQKMKDDFSRLTDFYSSVCLSERFQPAYAETEEKGRMLHSGSSLHSSGLYLWGAAAKGVMCENLLHGWQIDGVIDKNPQKQHKFIPVTGHPVLATSEISFDKVKIICVENEVYFSEICDEVEQIDPRIQVVLLEDFLRQIKPKD